MKRFFFYLFICSFVYFFISSFNSPVQAQACSSCSSTNCCGPSCNSSQFCSGNQIYGCFCDVIAPTNAPATCSSCDPPVPSDCAARSSCATGQCFPVCNYDTCIWGCTGDSSSCTQAECTAWSGWVCTSDGVTETRYCTAPAGPDPIKDCTLVSQARQPCSGPTPPGGGGPTDTPGPTSPPGTPPVPPTPTGIPSGCGLLGNSLSNFETGIGYDTWGPSGQNNTLTLTRDGTKHYDGNGTHSLKAVFTGGGNQYVMGYGIVSSAPAAGQAAVFTGHYMVNSITGSSSLQACIAHWVTWPSGTFIGSDCVPLSTSSIDVWQDFSLTSPHSANPSENNIEIDIIQGSGTGTANVSFDNYCLNYQAAPTSTPTPTELPTPTPTPIPPPILTCSPTFSGTNWSWNNLAGTISYWLQVWDDVWKANDWGYTSPTFTTGTPGVTYSGRVRAGDGTQTSPWSNTVSCTVLVPSAPTGLCLDDQFDPVTATTPVTWTWTNGTGIQVKDDSGKWWANIGNITSPYTVTKDNNNLGSIAGIPPGRTVYGRTTYDFITFSAWGSISPLPYCPLPANKTTVISGVLRQKSGTGCNQADFHMTNLSATTTPVDNCVTASCIASPDNLNAIAYSCTVLFDNQACVAQGRQPDTTQTLTINAVATGVGPGQFSDDSCVPINPNPNEKNLTITSGTNNLNANITFPVTNEKWVKLKDTSFTSASITSNNIPVVINRFTPSDPDDNTLQKYFIMNSLTLPGSSAGVALGITSNAYSDRNWYASSYTGSFRMDPSAFLSYVKSRKEYKTISDLSPTSIDKDGIYVWNGTIPLDLNSVPPQFNSFKVVLIVSGAVNINVSDFSPGKSLALLANQINFSNTTTKATGIFIANTIITGNPANQGLKIIGNLIAQSITNDRSWSDTSRPGLFIVFDPVQYIDLLPYLSIANYEWKQIQ